MRTAGSSRLRRYRFLSTGMWLKLAPGERVLADELLWIKIQTTWRIGRLVITNQRLAYIPHTVQAWPGRLRRWPWGKLQVWAVSEVAAVTRSEVKGPWMRGAATLDIQLLDGSHLLLKSSQREHDLAALSAATQARQVGRGEYSEPSGP